MNIIFPCTNSYTLYTVSISNRFFENQPNKICSHLSEKASKGRFLNPEKLQNHKNEGKRKEKRNSEEQGEEKKKTMVALLVFIMATLEFLAENNCWTPKVHLAVTLSKIRLDMKT